jgi:glycosyltransferase involved in cell wall biosynthesis
VYDCHDLMLVAAGRLHRPAWSRWIMARMQDRWVTHADRCVTVSQPMARELAALGLPEPVVVRNCPPRWDPPSDHVSPLRAALGVGPDVPLIMYHGAFLPNRGIDQLLRCIDRPGLESARLVFMGFGGLREEIETAAATHPRVHLVEPVPPSQLVSWLSGADVGAAVCGDSPNHRVTIPNKVFECIMAGVPIVVSDFEPWRAVVEDDPLGPLGRAVDPDDLDAITRALVELIEEGRREPSLRARCRRAGLDRLNWEVSSMPLRQLYRELAPGSAMLQEPAPEQVAITA